MRSLTFCKLTSVKIDCFAHIAYIASFTDYRRRIFACVEFIAHTTLRVLSCVALSISQQANVTGRLQKSTNDRALADVAWKSRGWI